jgi:HEAT repeat protein
VLPISALIERLAVAPGAADLVDLAGRGLGDLRLYERFGGDGVGTDDYEAVVDAWPRYRDLLGHADPSVRMAAAYLLALLVEPGEHTLPALEAAATAALDDAERASMLVAAGRLRASVLGSTSPGDPFRDGLALAPMAAAAPQPERGARALAQVMALPEGAWFYRRCRPEVADALAGLEGLAAGPWGGGDLGVLAAEFAASLSIEEPVARWSAAPDAPDAPDADDTPDAGEEEWEDFGDDDVDDPYTQSRPERQPPRVRLAGLHDVDWASLSHAYGRADGVPGMIDALSSPDPEDREWGLDALDASIHHQGSVYPSSTAAAPFLIELVGDERVDDRHDVLVLLAGIAVHEPSRCLVGGARQMRSEAFEAVAAGAPTYVRLLADPDPRVRNAAAFVLAFVEPVADGGPVALRAALAAETDRRARASQLLALGYVSRCLGDISGASALAPYLNHRCRLLRTAAAIGLIQMHAVQMHAAAPPEALAVLDDVRRSPAHVIGFWPWNDGDLQAYASTIRAAFMTTTEHLADLEDARAAGDLDRAFVAARSAFWALFDDDAHGPRRLWLPEEIDGPRRAVLGHLVETAATEVMPHWDHADALGLPGGVRDTRRLLGLERGPLDGTVEVDGHHRPLWAVLHDLLWWAEGDERAARLDALAGLDAPTRVAAVDDALSRAYGLWHRPFDDEHGSIDYDARNDHTSRYLMLLADMLGEAGPDGLAQARRIAAQMVPAGGRREADRATLAALVLARAGELTPEFDPLIALDQPPAGTYRLALREVFGHLPRERRLALVGEPRLYEYTAYRDPRGEVRRWQNGTGWQWIDLIAPEDAAPLVIAAIREWERHRAAGDDRAAEPVGGSVTSSIAHRSEDDPFPRKQAVEALGLAAAVAVAAIDAALADGSIADRDLLWQARNAATRLG